VKKIPLREEGLVGTLFYSGAPSSAILILGGASGGMRESKAEQLAAHGFAALALAYFSEEHLPPILKQIPVEYFTQAIAWLRKIEGIERIGIWGSSRGAEAALILGGLFPERIAAIVATTPSSVVYGALDHSDAPAWTFCGQPVAPNAPFILPNLEESSPIAMTPYFMKGMGETKAFAASAILVEKIRCPLLLISAEDDQMWPSALFARQIVDRLKAHGSPIPCTHLSYPCVGHAPGTGTQGFHPILKRWFAYGGTPQDNAAAAQDWGEQTLQFFKKWL
jgi:dienelactone hydrolase